MNRITVSIKLLKEKISEMENNQISFVELSLVPEQMEQSEINPAFLHFEGIEKNGQHTDFESIDESFTTDGMKTIKSA